MPTVQACFIHCSPECAAFARRLPEKWSKPAVPDPEPLPPPVKVVAEEADPDQVCQLGVVACFSPCGERYGSATARAA